MFGVMWVNNLSTRPPKSTSRSFEAMLAAGDVAKVTLINEKMVEVTLKPDAPKARASTSRSSRAARRFGS